MNLRTLFAPLVIGACLLPAHALAQDVAPAGFGIGISGSAITISPEENKREWGGIGNAWLQYTWPSGIQVLGGGGYGGVSAKEVGGFTVTGTRKVWNVFGDARLILNRNARSVAPYIGAHVAYLSHDLNTTFVDQELKVSGSGWNYAGAVGIYARLGDALTLDASLTFGVAPFSDPDATVGGQDVALQGTTTYSSSLGVGLVYTFGS